MPARTVPKPAGLPLRVSAAQPASASCPLAPWLVHRFESWPKSLHGSHTSAASLPAHPPASVRNASSIAAHSALPSLPRSPSPSSVRPWKRQIKRVSHLRRQRRHRPAPSESSSRALIDRHPWEAALDTMSLFSRSSTHSAESIAPSRHGSESARPFGKILFHPRPRSRQSRSSSASSLYSTHVSAEPPPPAPKDFLPGIFSRKKPHRDDTAPKRPQISGPFNFKHVQHKRREDAATQLQSHPPKPNLQAMSFQVALEDRAGLSSADAGDPRLPTSSRHVVRHLRSAVDTAIHHPSSTSRHAVPPSGLIRPAKLSLTPDQPQTGRARTICRPSTSPASSPHSPSFLPNSLPPHPSPDSARQRLPDQVVSCHSGRPRTSAGFVQARSLDIAGSEGDAPCSSTHRNRRAAIIQEASSVMARLSGVIWPLPSLYPALSGAELSKVQEDDKLGELSRLSNPSVVSIQSSLRGSQLVPMFRPRMESRRPISLTSETLGHSATAATPSVATIDERDQNGLEAAAPPESWEDDIDYCYEHEAEANCNYRWDRPSLETARGLDTPPVLTPLTDEGLARMKSMGSEHESWQHFPCLSLLAGLEPL